MKLLLGLSWPVPSFLRLNGLSILTTESNPAVAAAGVPARQKNHVPPDVQMIHKKRRLWKSIFCGVCGIKGWS